MAVYSPRNLTLYSSSLKMLKTLMYNSPMRLALIFSMRLASGTLRINKSSRTLHSKCLGTWIKKRTFTTIITLDTLVATNKDHLITKAAITIIIKAT
jgi:hypothetical protein